MSLARLKTKMLRLGFIGAGTVGTALAVRLSSKSYRVVAVSSRSRASAKNLAQELEAILKRSFSNPSP